MFHRCLSRDLHAHGVAAQSEVGHPDANKVRGCQCRQRTAADEPEFAIRLNGYIHGVAAKCVHLRASQCCCALMFFLLHALRHPRVAMLPFYNMTQPRFDLHEAGFCAFEGLRGKKPSDPPPYCWCVSHSPHRSDTLTGTRPRAATAHTIATRHSCGRLSFTTCLKRMKRRRRPGPEQLAAGMRKLSTHVRTSAACARLEPVHAHAQVLGRAGQGARWAIGLSGCRSSSEYNVRVGGLLQLLA